MIFSIENIKKKDNNISIDKSKSLFELSLDLIKENNSYQIITDSLCKENIPYLDKDGVLRIVDATCKSSIAVLSELYKNYLLRHDEMMNKVKGIITKDIVYSIDDDFIYTDYRYKYTNLRRVLSYSSLKTDINKESAILIQDLQKYAVSRQISEYYELIKEFELYQKNINIDIAVLCAYILGKNGPVDRHVFASALFRNFRECRIDMDSYISKEELMEIYDRYSTQDKEVAIMKNDFNKYIDDIAIIKSTLDNIPFDKLNKDTMNKEFESYPKDRICVWINIIKMILDIYKLFFAARLDASLESLYTDIDILIDAKKYVETRQLTDANKQ